MSGSRPPESVALDHGAIGNGRVLALVSPTSSIDWLCLPRFDSPSVFGRILDEEKGGSFRVLHRDRELRGEMAYVQNTNVLRTLFRAEGDCWEILDFAPRVPEGLDVRAPIEIVRIVRPLAGQPRLRIDFDPRPDYARVEPRIHQSDDAIVVEGHGAPLFLYTNTPIPYVLAHREHVLKAPIYFVLSYGRRSEVPGIARLEADLDRTIRGWRAWARSCALPLFAPEQVLRSALCLKLHVSHDTGAIIAAATTSIPEALGTERTWDYRYCWLRDAAFVVEALRRLSQLSEGEAFVNYLRDVAEGGPLQPLYSIDGGRALPEEFLPHLAGFRGNGHVRIGNAAHEQRQNDLMGEVILCLETLLSDARLVHDDPGALMPLVERLVEEAIVAAPTNDTGIWEFRSMLRPYTFSRAMCWAAIHRGARIAKRLGHRELAARWELVASAEQRTILERGYNAQLGFFTQSLDGDQADAANLLFPSIGLVEPTDPRFVSTVDHYERLLKRRGMILRYVTPDDFGQTTSSFTICSFWWIEALALVGRLDDAIREFENLARYQNHLGLYSEDIDPETGTLLGNFPQAYTHVGLIHAAMTIGELREVRDGTVRAWT